MITVQLEQGSESWFAEKLGKPSASNASKIITNAGQPSKQQEGYLYELVAQRLTGKYEETYQSMNMLIGNEREQESREAYEFMHQVKVDQVGVIYKDAQKKFLCSPDGLVQKLKYGLELKNVLPKTQVKYLLGNKLPSEYHGQSQFSLYVTGFQFWMFMSYAVDLKPLIVKVKRDEVYIRALAKELNGFCKRLDETTEKLR